MQLELNLVFISSRRAQLLEGEKLLLVVADRAGNLNVYFERLAGMDGAIARGRGKPLNREKIGQEFLLAYDESKKMLAVVSSDKVRVCLRYHGYDFDSNVSFVHSSYCTFSCATTRGDFRRWEAQ